MDGKISFKRYFWVFVIVSILGTYYEEILHAFIHLFRDGMFDWSRRRGLFWGPFSPVYGLGAIFLLFFLKKDRHKKWKLFIGASLLGGITEFVLSLLQEWLLGTRSWNYSGMFLNIDGRTTVPFMVGWGIAGVVLISWFYPKLDDFFKRIPQKIYKTGTILVMILVFLDIGITVSAIARMELRQKGILPYTFVGKLYDEYFTDEYIEEKYPNTEEKDEK